MVAIIVKCHIDSLSLSFIAPIVAIICRLTLSLLAPTDAPLAITGCHDVPEQGDRPTLHCDVPPELAGHRSPHLHYHPGDARPNHSGLLCVQLCHELHHSRTVHVLPCHGSQRQEAELMRHSRCIAGRVLLTDEIVLKKSHNHVRV